MTKFLLLSLFFISSVALAKNKFPVAKAQFLTKNTWRGTTKVSFVKFICFGDECTWKETDLDQCLQNTTQVFIYFHPSMYLYSTSGNGHLVEKMKVKMVSKDVFSVSLDAGQNVTSEYVVTLNCPAKGQLAEPGCEVKAVTGSMIDVNSERTTYDLVDAKNLKDLKLDRCQ
jgi:hypothetical protein